MSGVHSFQQLIMSCNLKANKMHSKSICKFFENVFGWTKFTIEESQQISLLEVKSKVQLEMIKLLQKFLLSHVSPTSVSQMHVKRII